MLSKHHVEVRNRDVVYKFDLNRNITIIRGDSGTGKTTLYEMIVDSATNPGKSGVSIVCDKKCDFLTSRLWDIQLESMDDCIVFIDDDQQFVSTKEFANSVKKSNNYFVLITREELHELPYSADDIYEIKSSGKLHTLKRMYECSSKHAYSKDQASKKENLKSGF